MQHVDRSSKSYAHCAGTRHSHTPHLKYEPNVSFVYDIGKGCASVAVVVVRYSLLPRSIAFPVYITLNEIASARERTELN